MRLWVTQLTQDEEQSLFTIKINMPIPKLVYGDSFQWAKYVHHILPSTLDLTSHNKVGLHQTFWNSLIEFLCTDLDGNLGFTLNPLAASKLDHFLSIIIVISQRITPIISRRIPIFGAGAESFYIAMENHSNVALTHYATLNTSPRSSVPYLLAGNL